MKRITKAQAKQRKADWQKALQEGRVIRFGDQPWSWTSYPTYERATIALNEALDSGIPALRIHLP